MAVKMIINNIRLPRILRSNCIFTLLKLDCSLGLACYGKTDDGRQRTEDRGRRTPARRDFTALSRGQRTEDGRQRTEDRGRKTEDGRQRTEDRGRKTEDRRQRTEDRGQKAEDRRQILDTGRRRINSSFTS